MANPLNKKAPVKTSAKKPVKALVKKAPPKASDVAKKASAPSARRGINGPLAGPVKPRTLKQQELSKAAKRVEGKVYTAKKVEAAGTAKDKRGQNAEKGMAAYRNKRAEGKAAFATKKSAAKATFANKKRDAIKAYKDKKITERNTAAKTKFDAGTERINKRKAENENVAKRNAETKSTNVANQNKRITESKRPVNPRSTPMRSAEDRAKVASEKKAKGAAAVKATADKRIAGKAAYATKVKAAKTAYSEKVKANKAIAVAKATPAKKVASTMPSANTMVKKSAVVKPTPKVVKPKLTKPVAVNSPVTPKSASPIG